MDPLNERKLKETFSLQKEQCTILLNDMQSMCKSLKYYQDELECNVLDEELSKRIQETTDKILISDNNLKNTLTCITSSLSEMNEEFGNFRVDEDQETFCPNYELQLNEQIKLMNQSRISTNEIQNDRRRLDIIELINQMQNVVDDDFAEIDTHLDKIPIDPFTQKEIEIPVRNVRCKHVYDKSGILNYINQKAGQNKSAKCPTIGCLNKSKLTFNDLVEDLELKEKIDRLRHNS